MAVGRAPAMAVKSVDSLDKTTPQPNNNITLPGPFLAILLVWYSVRH